MEKKTVESSNAIKLFDLIINEQLLFLSEAVEIGKKNGYPNDVEKYQYAHDKLKYYHEKLHSLLPFPEEGKCDECGRALNSMWGKATKCCDKCYENLILNKPRPESQPKQVAEEAIQELLEIFDWIEEYVEKFDSLHKMEYGRNLLFKVAKIRSQFKQ